MIMTRIKLLVEWLGHPAGSYLRMGRDQAETLIEREAAVEVSREEYEKVRGGGEPKGDVDPDSDNNEEGTQEDKAKAPESPAADKAMRRKRAGTETK